MNKKVIALWIITALIMASLMLPYASPRSVAVSSKSVSDIAMFQATKFTAHYRMPRDVDIERILRDEGVLMAGTGADGVQAAVQEFMREFAKRNPDTPNPGKLREVLKAEQMGGPKPKPESPIKSLAILMEFPNESTFDWCGESVTFSGPLHNEAPPPGPRDNNTIWFEDTTPELYEELFFGVGPDAGVIVNHPNLGAVDLRGYTMANYYLEQSEGTFLPAGMIYPKWLQAIEAEAWYGQDSCDGGNHNVYAHELVIEAVDQVMADNPDFPWQDFDGNGDGIVDNFTVIHAGYGQESGGGAQGDFAIWSHASAILWPTGKLACAAGSAGCPDRDIFVREYSMDPEHIDTGVIAEEFGHAAFGLPDLYTTDYQQSIANWSIMEAGSWNGILGGMQPAPFPLWFRYIIGWAHPVELDYTTAAEQIKVGQHSLRPGGTEQGIKINLPDQEITTPNPMGTGQAFWSDLGDYMQHTLAHEFDLTTAVAPVFSFASYWSLEVDWDGGYVEVSTDGGATWTAIADMDGYFTPNPLSGNNPDLKPVLTGEGEGTLRFDLAPYVGQVIMVRLSYVTDAAVQWDGWWADDLSLDDGATNLFFDDVETGGVGWVNDGWLLVPLSNIYPRYYLVEWRNLSGFDRGLAYPYQTVYSDDDEWWVDRAPYSVPGMLVYYRDTSYLFDYTLGDSWYDPPSWGPKHGLILVDSHSFPYGWSERFYSTGAPYRLSDRVQAADASFTMQNTTPFTIRRFDYALDDVVETKTFGPRPAVSQFHDSMGYYPGFYYIGDGYLYWRNIAASAVVPAKDNYTTKITDLEGNPLYDLYGIDVGGTILGSGNPGDDGVQFGLHMAVIDKAKDGSWGMIKVWNSPTLTTLTKTVNLDRAKPGQMLKYKLVVTNNTPVRQNFSVSDPIPANTTFLGPSWYYNAATNSIEWSGWVPPYATRVTVFIVKINPGTPSGTVITNEAFLTDEAQGGSASAATTVR